jgi:hypothetical protein
MDPSDVHPDLMGEALSHSGQQLAQLGSLLVSWATVHARRAERRAAAEAARDEQQFRELRDQEIAARRLARAGWEPARDRQWLSRADLLKVGRAWSAAAAWADADPNAASAMARCESRLRDLHPYAMARYDRLRAEGAQPFEAMRDVVAQFGRAPRARPGEPGAERRALAATPGGRRAGGSPWQWTDYEAPVAAGSVSVPGDEPAAATGVVANPVRLAAQGFPCSAADAVKAGAQAGARQSQVRAQRAGQRSSRAPTLRLSGLPPALVRWCSRSRTEGGPRGWSRRRQQTFPHRVCAVRGDYQSSLRRLSGPATRSR